MQSPRSPPLRTLRRLFVHDNLEVGATQRVEEPDHSFESHAGMRHFPRKMREMTHPKPGKFSILGTFLDKASRYYAFQSGRLIAKVRSV